MPSQIPSTGPPSFQLFEGGLFSWLFRALAPARVEPLSIGRSAGLLVLITWIPMALLAALQGIALQGIALGPSPQQPLLSDAAMYARFWVALPVLLLTSAVCGPRLRLLVQHFLDAGLIKELEREQFHANVSHVMQSVESPAVDVLLLATAYLYSVYLVTALFPVLPASWRTLGPPAEPHLSWAAWWLVAISQPLYVFAVLRFLRSEERRVGKECRL